jgi:hypothetical protein
MSYATNSIVGKKTEYAMSPASHDEGKPPAPPYVAYRSFRTLIGGFKTRVLPNRIDRSVLDNFSGIVGSQLLTALRFLKLIDKENRPQHALEGLVRAFGTERWPPVLANVIKAAYAPIFELDLKVASPSQFVECFGKVYPGEGSTQRKCRTFFLNAVQDAKIEISPFTVKNMKPRSGPTKKRSARQHGPQSENNDSAHANPPPPPPPPSPQSQTPRKLSERVLAMLDAEVLPSEIEAAVFTLLRYLRKEGK